MDIEQQEQQTFDEEVKDYFLMKAADILKKQEVIEKQLWRDINSENRKPDEEILQVTQLMKIERFLKYYEMLIECADQILESLNSNDRKITDQVEEDFLYGGIILEEMQDCEQNVFKKLLEKYEINTTIDPTIRQQIKSRFEKDDKIEPKDVEQFLKQYQKKFGVKSKGDENKDSNDNDDNESQWDASSSVAGDDLDNNDDVLVLDEEMLEAMDKSYDEEGNEIHYDESNPGEQILEDEEGQENEGEDEEEKKNQEDGDESNTSSIVEREKTIDMSMKTFLKHTDFVSCISFHPTNPDLFISGGGDDIARVWNINNNDKPELETPKQNETVEFAKFSFDGKYFATGALDGTVKIWDATTGEFKRALEGPADEIKFIDWHSKGNVIIAGSADNSAWMWNAASGQYMASFNGHEQPLSCGRFTLDGNMIITGSEDATIRVWKPKTGELHKKISGFGFHEEMITCLDLHPTQQIVLSGSTDKTACLSNFNTGKVLGRTVEHEDGVETVLFDHKMDIFFTGSLDGFVRIFDSNRCSLKDKISVNASITRLIQLKEKNLVVVANCQGDIYYLDHRVKGKLGKVTSGQDGMIHDMAIHKSHRILASFDDGSIKLFELPPLS